MIKNTTLTSSRRATNLCTMSRRLWSHIEARDLRLQGITMAAMAIGGKSFEKALHLHFLSFPIISLPWDEDRNCKSRDSWRNFSTWQPTAHSPQQSKLPPRKQSSGWHFWKPETVWNTAIMLVKYINRYEHSKPWPLASINRGTESENTWNNDPHLLFGSTIAVSIKQYSSLVHALQLQMDANGISSVQKHQNHFYQIHQVQHV